MQGSAGTEPDKRAYLDVVGVGKAFKGTTVMSDMDFRVARGELVSLLGPSGCGKTTLLRIIAGLTSADAGDILLDGRAITRVPAHRRNISVVFQSYALFPHLTVAENVAFGLRARSVPKGDIAPKVSEALQLVRMRDFADRPVAALSGGQQQRVAVARALVVDPVLLLLDEPFSALDRKLRETMQVELKSLLRDRGMTAIFVTHDQEEAMGVSDRIAVMNSGQIEQFATPSELCARPRSSFVMDFVGLSTRMRGRVSKTDGPVMQIDTANGMVLAQGDYGVGTEVTVGVRPELITPVAGENTIKVTLADAMVLGAKTQLHGASHPEDRLLCEVPGIQTNLTRGQDVTFGWSVKDTLVYEAPR
ncbi:ABC transporter ATP-binding protein [Marivita cryptomonadis]|uniref:ABC transporter ATP-binding protein n=1 Tax=Marivita cryptomonadis TaxID=505252 RepID=UPI00193AC32E|nr:ABC transporter ATP-binding protein [Marivita cryptomonadis]MBM2432135.1 ABC transporter ATP-binding protein [Marivita cryptomonadis]MBM2450902.1 ABC transporter ATP-binding protein [Marivita cryptomonadis]MBM2464894.1 ABC transporter ATP-binding protein [Marivita cryptomonadis]MBM2469414.1 ABC transporter ATP-binding protein [Marivita cryptomonadis]MBM2478888.1 ABC transporter ATP-binding protein [Marivita cryptomonadis]